MPLYMTQFTYTPEAWAALAKNPQDRRDVLGPLAQKLGGRLISLYYSFGEYDGLVISEAPNEKVAAALAIAASTAGHLKSIKTTPLLSVEDAMDMMRMVGGVTYSAPKSS